MPRRMNFATSSFSPPLEAGHHHVGEAVEVLLPLAAAHVDAEAGRVVDAHLRQVLEARVGHRLLGGADGEMRVPPLKFPVFGFFAGLGDVPIADFGGDFGGELAGVEQGDIVHARLAGPQPPPHGFHVRPQRRHAADAGHYNPSSHDNVPSWKP